MAASHDEKSGLFWSLVSWGAGILAALIVGWIIAKLFGEAAAGIVFGGVTFVIVTWVLSLHLGPRTDDAAPHLPATAHAAMSAGHGHVAAQVAPAAAPAPAPLPAPEAGVISERVRDAARAAGEAARAALGDLAPGPGPGRPAALAAPLAEGPDNLMRLRGVGPKFAEVLNANGIYHFSQIAAWGPGEIAWIESNIEGFSGRVVRDDWVGQAKILAAGGETEHSQRVDRGEFDLRE